MRWIVWLVLLFAAAGGVATLIGHNEGLVSVFWPPWRLDLSLNLFVIGLLATFALLYLTTRVAHTALALPRRARQWRVARRERAAQHALREALAEFFAGRYTRAHKAAERALRIHADLQARFSALSPDLTRDAEFAALGQTLAAGSMHRLQDRERRDEHLRLAMERSAQVGVEPRSAEVGARLLAADWALEDRDPDRALEILGELAPGVARRTQALRLKLHAARLAEQPVEALKTARLLAKHQAFSPVAAQGLVRSLAFEALDTARDAEQLRGVWAQLETSEKRDAFVVAHAARAAAGFGRAGDGRLWLARFWDDLAERSADERLVLSHALAACASGMTADWLPRLEAALAGCPQDLDVAYAVGHALAEVQLWGKARLQLERAASATTMDPAARRDAWLRLAGMADREGDQARAARCYKQAALIRA